VLCTREVSAKGGFSGGNFELHDGGVLVLLALGFETLPRELSSNQVNKDIHERFKVISSTLLYIFKIS
jgi:hypothetical protein